MGISDKKLLFGGAIGRDGGTPWATLGEITGRALAPYGYEVEIEGRSWGPGNPRWVSDGRVDIGACLARMVRMAYDGIRAYSSEGPRKNLRMFAAINMPSWMAVAVRWETGITDLGQIKERRLPVRVVDKNARDVSELIWSYYGLSRASIESWGGKFLPLPSYPESNGVPGVNRNEWVRSGVFDVVLEHLYTGYAPEMSHWHDAASLYDLRFLTLPDDLIAKIVTEVDGEPGVLPHHLYRGIDHDIPTVMRGPQVIYGRDDVPEDFGYLLAKALDEGRHHFRQTHLPFSYDPKNVADTRGLPLHPGAERYYREVGYLE